MEDEHFQTPSGDFLAVFDGHGGRAVARYLRQNLYANVISILPLVGTNGESSTIADHGDEPDDQATVATASHPSLDDYEDALRKALDKVDREVQRVSHWSFQGSTAVALWIYADATQRAILTANIGDSRAVLSRKQIALDLTTDHKPNAPKEKARIESRGGKVVWSGRVDKRGRPIESQGVYRVNGNLALSRAMGDRSERPAVTAEPDITRIEVSDQDEFIVVATDGLWDVMSSQEVVTYIHALLESHNSNLKPDYRRKALQDNMANLLVAEALKRGTMDNVTIVILWLHPVR
jgi:serine/threonine protein phosphatase PrpC